MLEVLQDLVAASVKTLQESRVEVQRMDWHRGQLQLIWSREDVQSWLTAFSNVISDTQQAHGAVLDAALNLGQVSFYACVA